MVGMILLLMFIFYGPAVEPLSSAEPWLKDTVLG